MSQLKAWFQKAVTTILDPDRETRVTRLVEAIQHAMQARGQAFTLGPLVAAVQPDQLLLPEICELIHDLRPSGFRSN